MRGYEFQGGSCASGFRTAEKRDRVLKHQLLYTLKLGAELATVDFSVQNHEAHTTGQLQAGEESAIASCMNS